MTTWLASFACCPAPGPPIRYGVPSRRKSGSILATAAASPPQRIASVAAFAPASPPVTGASTQPTPSACACAARSFDSPGLDVVKSTSTLPFFSAGSTWLATALTSAG